MRVSEDQMLGRGNIAALRIKCMPLSIFMADGRDCAVIASGKSWAGGTQQCAAESRRFDPGAVRKPPAAVTDRQAGTFTGLFPIKPTDVIIRKALTAGTLQCSVGFV